MKRHILKLFLLISAGLSLQSCFNLDEEVFDRVDKSIYYSDESSVKGAVAAIYNKAAMSYVEYFYYLQEFSADQIAWRSWNGHLVLPNGHRQTTADQMGRQHRKRNPHGNGLVLR